MILNDIFMTLGVLLAIWVVFFAGVLLLEKIFKDFAKAMLVMMAGASALLAALITNLLT